MTKLVGLIQLAAMSRRARIAPGEQVYHTLNRAIGRSELFSKPEDYAAFERIMVAATEAEIEALRKCVNRGTPYGSEAWKTRIANALGLESSLQPRGRPKKAVA